MNFEASLKKHIRIAVKELYQTDLEENAVQTNFTIDDFSGDITILIFPLVKISKKSPEITGQELGKYLQTNIEFIQSFNVVKGFLNIEIKTNYWISFINNLDCAITDGSYCLHASSMMDGYLYICRMISFSAS